MSFLSPNEQHHSNEGKAFVTADENIAHAHTQTTLVTHTQFLFNRPIFPLLLQVRLLQIRPLPKVNCDKQTHTYYNYQVP